jgi:hypothetical protein
LNKAKTGIYTTNELRTENGLPELDGGDQLFNVSETENPSTAEEQEQEEDEGENAKQIFVELMKKEGYKTKQINKQIEELEKEGLL